MVLNPNTIEDLRGDGHIRPVPSRVSRTSEDNNSISESN